MFCNLGDVQIHYKIHGEGIPIIMIHGFTMDYRLMEGCMEPVFKEVSGFKRIYLDLPGMGQTKGEEWLKGTDDMLDAVLRFIDHVIPGQPFLIAGESYGGYLARGVLKKSRDYVFLEKIKQNYAFTFSLDLDEPYEHPTLFFAGRQDAVVGFKDHWNIMDQFPRAAFAVLDRAGHNLQIEQPAVFHALVVEWLNRVEENLFLKKELHEKNI